ncbi:unnamed protein product [Brassica rapa subsp. narinosa]
MSYTSSPLEHVIHSSNLDQLANFSMIRARHPFSLSDLHPLEACRILHLLWNTSSIPRTWISSQTSP